MLSTLQPTPAVLLSLPMRQRSTMFCPAAAAGRFTVVVIKPADAAAPCRTSSRVGWQCVASIVAIISASDEAAAGSNDIGEGATADADLQHAAVKKGSSTLERVILSEGQLRGRARDGDGWRVEPLVADHSRIIHQRRIGQ